MDLGLLVPDTEYTVSISQRSRGGEWGLIIYLTDEYQDESLPRNVSSDCRKPLPQLFWRVPSEALLQALRRDFEKEKFIPFNWRNLHLGYLMSEDTDTTS